MTEYEPSRPQARSASDGLRTGRTGRPRAAVTVG
ncbi:hypothetical protein SHL15_7087 [Streptomyces hygroscopicus subsp. limoneus]|nr:hypothetical protein SHL15_7087 [Streptomyces hygroscopicus subsp. limoneus]